VPAPPGASGAAAWRENQEHGKGPLGYGPAVDDNDDGYFGERVAASYGQNLAEMFEFAAVGPAVEVLAGLAGRGRALELGIGMRLRERWDGWTGEPFTSDSRQHVSIWVPMRGARAEIS
jgi:hypothetical protein